VHIIPYNDIIHVRDKTMKISNLYNSNLINKKSEIVDQVAILLHILIVIIGASCGVIFGFTKMQLIGAVIFSICFGYTGWVIGHIIAAILNLLTELARCMNYIEYNTRMLLLNNSKNNVQVDKIIVDNMQVNSNE
jgi:hypothetical protein